MTNFQFVNANQLRANIVNTLAWYGIAFWVDCTKFFNTHRQIYQERN